MKTRRGWILVMALAILSSLAYSTAMRRTIEGPAVDFSSGHSGCEDNWESPA